MSRDYYGFRTTIQKGDRTIAVFEKAVIDSILLTLPTSGEFCVSIAHENTRGFAKQVSNFLVCSQYMGATVCCGGGAQPAEMVTARFASGAWFVYSAALCAVAPGRWPVYTDVTGAARRLLKNYVPGDFQKFARTGICDSPLMKVTDLSRVDEIDGIMCAAKAEIAGILAI